MFNRGVLEQIYLLHSSLISLGLTYSSLILSCLNTPFWARQPDVGPALADGPDLLIRGWFLVMYHRNHRSSADTLLWHSVIQTGRFGSLREIDGETPNPRFLAQDYSFFLHQQFQCRLDAKAMVVVDSKVVGVATNKLD